MSNEFERLTATIGRVTIKDTGKGWQVELPNLSEPEICDTLYDAVHSDAVDDFRTAYATVEERERLADFILSVKDNNRLPEVTTYKAPYVPPVRDRGLINHHDLRKETAQEE